LVNQNIEAEEFEKAIHVLTDEDKISLRYWITFVEKNGIVMAFLKSNFRP
jgi:hypothetical protein